MTIPQKAFYQFLFMSVLAINLNNTSAAPSANQQNDAGNGIGGLTGTLDWGTLNNLIANEETQFASLISTSGAFFEAPPTETERLKGAQYYECLKMAREGSKHLKKKQKLKTYFAILAECLISKSLF